MNNSISAYLHSSDLPVLRLPPKLQSCQHSVFSHNAPNSLRAVFTPRCQASTVCDACRYNVFRSMTETHGIISILVQAFVLADAVMVSYALERITSQSC